MNDRASGFSQLLNYQSELVFNQGTWKMTEIGDGVK